MSEMTEQQNASDAVDNSREEIVKAMFGEVGKVIEG